MRYLATIQKTPALLVFLAALSTLSGCSTWFSSGFKKPDVQLIDVELVHAKLLEQQFILHFRVDMYRLFRFFAQNADGFC